MNMTIFIGYQRTLSSRLGGTVSYSLMEKLGSSLKLKKLHLLSTDYLGLFPGYLDPDVALDHLLPILRKDLFGEVLHLILC